MSTDTVAPASPPAKISKSNKLELPTLLTEYLSVSPTYPKRDQRFNVSDEAWFELGRIEYNAFVSCDTRFNRRYSFSEYQHMRCVMLTLRKYQLWPARYAQAAWVDDALKWLNSNNILMPQSSYIYLESLGSFTLFTGERFVMEPAEVNNSGRFANIPDPNQPNTNRNDWQNIVGLYVSQACPHVTATFIQDEIAVPHVAIGTTLIASNVGVTQPFVDSHEILGTPITYPMLNERRASAAVSCTFRGLMNISSRLRCNQMMVQDWIAAMNSISTSISMVSGFPSNVEGSKAQGLIVNTDSHGLIDNVEIGVSAGYDAVGSDFAKAIMFKYQLDRRRSQDDQYYHAAVAGVPWFPTDYHLRADIHMRRSFEGDTVRIPFQPTHARLTTWVHSGVRHR